MIDLKLTRFSILFGVLYWYIWTVFIPRWRSYTLEEVEEVLDDGTTITKLVQVPEGSKLVSTTDDSE
jgi:hypothetical protein